MTNRDSLCGSPDTHTHTPISDGSAELDDAPRDEIAADKCVTELVIRSETNNHWCLTHGCWVDATAESFEPNPEHLRRIQWASQSTDVRERFVYIPAACSCPRRDAAAGDVWDGHHDALCEILRVILPIVKRHEDEARRTGRHD